MRCGVVWCCVRGGVLCAVCFVLCAVCYVCAVVLRTNTGVTLLLPQVHSLSLGAPEDEVGDDIIKRMNTEMAALGVRGVSVVFASGDSGYGKYQKYGAASPYVTSVGGIYNGRLKRQRYRCRCSVYFICAGGVVWCCYVRVCVAVEASCSGEMHGSNLFPLLLPLRLPLLLPQVRCATRFSRRTH